MKRSRVGFGSLVLAAAAAALAPVSTPLAPANVTQAPAAKASTAANQLQQQAPAPAAATPSVAQFYMPSSLARAIPRHREPIWLGYPRPRRPVAMRFLA